MKAFILLGLLVSGMAHAEFYCAINAENKKEAMTFDRTLHQGPANEQQMWVVSPDQNSVSKFPSGGKEIIAAWSTIQRGVVIHVSPLEDDSFVIGALKMRGSDITKSASQQLGMASTTLKDVNSSLALYVPEAKVYVVCTRIN